MPVVSPATSAWRGAGGAGGGVLATGTSSDAACPPLACSSAESSAVGNGSAVESAPERSPSAGGRGDSAAADDVGDTNSPSVDARPPPSPPMDSFEMGEADVLFPATDGDDAFPTRDEPSRLSAWNDGADSFVPSRAPCCGAMLRTRTSSSCSGEAIDVAVARVTSESGAFPSP